MTFRARPVVKRTDRAGRSPRRSLLLNLGFGLVIVVALLILAAAAAASYYGDHLASIASVNGHDISKDQLRDRIKVEQFRLSITQSRITDAMQTGRLDQATGQQQLDYIDQQLSTGTVIEQAAITHLVDAELQSELAAPMGISVTEQQIDGRIVEEATTDEQRHAWVIAVKPELTGSATKPTDAQKKAAQDKINQALADLKAGKTWEDIAKKVSTDFTSPQGGDMGWIQATDNTDKAFVDALFKLQQNGMTDVILGSDDIYRIGRVTEIRPKEVDPNYQQKLLDHNVPQAVYRAAVKGDLFRTALEAKVVAAMTDQPTVQRKVSELFIQAAQDDNGNPITKDQVEVRHILYAPNDAPDKAAALPDADPAWKKAEAEAKAAYEKLKADPNPKTFQALAKKESDDKGSGANGGDLPWAYQSAYDQAFANAIFAPALKKDEILPPVKSSFGWHVIQFIDRRQPTGVKIAELQVQANLAGADFGAIAKANSDAPQSEKDKGGDIGWVAHFQLDANLDKAIFNTKVGAVSEPVDDNGSSYLLKVFDEQTRLPDQSQIDALKQSGFNNWYADQKTKAKINAPGSTPSTIPGAN